MLQIKGLCKSFSLGGEKIDVLRGVDLDVSAGDFISIMGTSGSGKSTLLHILGCLAEPSSGSYFLNGKNVSGKSDRERSWIRAHWIGFVFQTFDLLNELSVTDNVALPFLYTEISRKRAKELVDSAIEQVGLGHRRNHRPAELSGGEMQRVAIARALAVNPKVILADEPTGNLDRANSKAILELFQELHRNGATIITVTHDYEVARASQRIYRLEEGRLGIIESGAGESDIIYEDHPVPDQMTPQR